MKMLSYWNQFLNLLQNKNWNHQIQEISSHKIAYAPILIKRENVLLYKLFD